MEKIKEILFKKCDILMSVYLTDKKQFGEYDEFTISSRAAFCAIYRLIEDCKLEEEYLSWKRAAEQPSRETI